MEKKDAKLAMNSDPIKAYKMALDQFGDEITKDVELRHAFVDYCKWSGFRGSIQQVKESEIRRYAKYGKNHRRHHYFEKLYSFVKYGEYDYINSYWM